MANLSERLRADAKHHRSVSRFELSVSDKLWHRTPAGEYLHWPERPTDNDIRKREESGKARDKAASESAIADLYDQAATILDRLTVEGLAKTVERLSWQYGGALLRGEATVEGRSDFMAAGLLEMITTPSVEESHD